MKRIIRILILAITLVTGITTVSAQTVQVLLNQKVAALPSTVTSYLDGPFRYFNIQFIVNGAGSEGLDIYFDMNMTINTNPLYVRTRPGSLPLRSIHLSEGVNNMNGDELNTQVLIRTETNFDYTNLDYSNIANAQQLPEGTYTMCVDIHRWEDRFDANPVSLTVGPCPTFVICYSGSAPELVAPMAGAQLTLNGDLVVTPNRKINFFWTPVISNCAGKRARFKYKLKVVKVINGQNYRDAIRVNPTVLSTEVRNTNTAVFDTLRDIKVNMVKGALYVAQVQAEQIKNGYTTENFIVANEGKSQPMPFYWGYNDDLFSSILGIDDPNVFPPGTQTTIIGGKNNNKNVNPKNRKYSRTYGYTVDDESEEGDETEGVDGLTQWEGGVEEVSELESIMDEMKNQYLAGFIQDDAAIASLTETYPEEREYVPTPKRRYVESDGYYTVPMTDDLEVSFMPPRHNSLKDVYYAIELYDYVDGSIDSTLSYEPLFGEVIEEIPESYNEMDSHELVNHTLTGWGTELEEGHLYYLQLLSFSMVDYWQYAIADTNFYVNEMLAEHVHDTVSSDYVEEELTLSNGVLFRWGNDPEAPDFTTPQWKAPLDRTSDDIYDPANYGLPTTIPELKKAKTFPISWTPVKNVAKGDEVEYEVSVFELGSGQTLEEAISANEALVSRIVTDANEISENDTDFFKVFSSKKTYVMTLSTNVKSESNTYHFENGNKALPVIFKVVK
jgi:hypothetical protein